MPPEVMNYPDNEDTEGLKQLLNESITTPTVDLWAAGCIAIELCTGRPPFDHKGGGMKAVLYVARLSIAKKDEVDFGVPPDSTDPAMYEFIQGALSLDPRQRPRAAIYVPDHGQDASKLQNLAQRYDEGEV